MPLHLDLLGAFHLKKGGQPVTGFEHPRLQHLLAYLVLHRTAPISRRQLAYLFWPDSPDQQALKNLRTLLTRLRQALPDVDLFIQITPQAIAWRPDSPFTLDVAEFEMGMSQAAAAKETGDYVGTVNALESAVHLYTGELLPDCYDDWILPQRERCQQACRDALERLVLLLEEHREYGKALPYASQLLNHDPLSETAYHHLIRLYLALGNRTEALRFCRECDAMLELEFGKTSQRATQDQYAHLLEVESPPMLAAMEQRLGTGPSGAPLVGRNAEWTRLVTAWRSAAAGHPQMILLSGDAGIGKTRLAEEMCAWVARQGGIVGLAHCHPAGSSAVAYAPVIEWLHDRTLQGRVAALADVWLVEIARILPSLLAERPTLKSPGPLTESWQRTRLFEALAHAILGSDHATPLLLFLDDLQWCDQETLDWLGYLLRFDARAPLMIVTSVRKYEIDRVHPLMAFWFALTRSGLLNEIPLGPLDRTETGMLAANVAGRVVDTRETNQIYTDTEGNPLFVVEMVRAGMAARGMEKHRNQETLEPGYLDETPISSTPAALPPKVRAVIQWRLAQLSPTAQALAQTAAVIGREFNLDVLVRASRQDEQGVMEGLEELWQRHLVRVQNGSIFDFTHNGIRVVAYDDTSPVRRRDVHLRVAQALEELHHDDLDALSIQIAGHYEQAGQPLPACAFYRRGASIAEGIYANTAAAQIYQHLLESELSVALPAPERCAVRLALAEVWRATGRWNQAEAISQDALAEAEVLGDIRLVARSKCVLADVLHLLGYYETALQWLAEAEQGFQTAGDWRGVAGALWIMGEIHWLRGDHPRALAALERQLEIATDINDPSIICKALEAIGMVQWSQGDWNRAADNCVKAYQIASPREYKPVLIRSSTTLGNICTGEHRYGEAISWYQRAGIMAQEIDDRRALSWATSNIALILAKRGDYERASAGYGRSLRIAWEIGDRLIACLNVARLATVYERQGRVNEAEWLYRQAVDIGLRLCIPGYLSGMLVGLAQLLLTQGQSEEARGIYQEALAQISGVAGARLVGEDIHFEAQVLGIRLQQALGEATVAETAAELRNLLLHMEASPQQAALYYELWRLEPVNETFRKTAAERYHTEYTETGNEESYRRYMELTGEALPDPPPLPAISDLIPDHPDDIGLESILADLKSSFE
ncbi:MAG: tetratricopeptide repeat protein [Anaerolineales bacterium]|nr:tetratricopeptide repeat protein [Anaerolineales bacterium]